MEVIGALAASAQLVSQCIAALQYIKFVLDQYRNGSETLKTVAEDVDLVLNIVNLIKREPTLGCDEVMAGVKVVQNRAIDLRGFVEDLDQKFKKDGALHRMALFVTAGQDQEKLEGMRRDLHRANVGLVGILSVAKIGLRKMENQVVINVFTIEQVDEDLRSYQALKDSIIMAKFVRERGISVGQGQLLGNQGEVKLSDDDLEILEAMVADAQALKDKMGDLHEVCDNTARGFSSMINGNIGDGTADKNAFVRTRRTIIKGNLSEGNAFMLNANTSMNALSMHSDQHLRQYVMSQNMNFKVPDDLFDLKKRAYD
ncbi:hypothetical protein Brms1b_005766 [Colletotrichum noveboracense]|nr:hypothetical protein COL940_005195 [Colletotrichum noveboracense]KAJ0289434.1 hypothetical protein CBS470a_004382 [Colletotrichum nupharicola]KAJ0315929.1 hypothetical protein Brms1b_005766 [Colletotrichum noveboracense]